MLRTDSGWLIYRRERWRNYGGCARSRTRDSVAERQNCRFLSRDNHQFWEARPALLTRNGRNEELGHSCLTSVLAYAGVVVQHRHPCYGEKAFSYETPWILKLGLH